RLLTASNGNIADSKLGNDYQSMDDKLLKTCVYNAIFLCFFGQSHQDKVLLNHRDSDAAHMSQILFLLQSWKLILPSIALELLIRKICYKLYEIYCIIICTLCHCEHIKFKLRLETIIYNVTKYMDITNFLQYVLKQQKINEGLNEYMNDIKSGYEYITFATTMDILDNYLRNHPARRSCFSIRILYGVLLYDVNKKYIEMVSSYHLSFQIKVPNEHQKILEKVVEGDILQHIYLKLMIVTIITNKSKSLQKNDTYSFLADVNTNGENCKIKRIIVLGLE
uniref:Uncharacterized protein n=1 Tax=Strongyloides stercoralis TaxID=6248 RepID=A0AAF5DKQ2_STRER